LTLFKHKDNQSEPLSGWEPRSLISVTKDELKKITDYYSLILERINTGVLNDELLPSSSSPSNKEAGRLRMIPKSNSSEVEDEEEVEEGTDDDTD